MLALGNILFDNEHRMMMEIKEKENITQRELSKKLGVSVSTVNSLMKKMIQEGLVKMTQMPTKQVFYILTPDGLKEKTKKTVRYLKMHYRAIYQTKEKIKEILLELASSHDAIFVLKSADELGEIMAIAINELDLSQKEKVVVVHKHEKWTLNSYQSPVMVCDFEDESKFESIQDQVPLTFVHLMDRL